MVASLKFPAFLSGLTRALLIGTGWYYVKANTDQVYEWAAQAGCSYRDQSCPSIPEQFCTRSVSTFDVCGPEFYAKGSCVGRDHKWSQRNCDLLEANTDICLLGNPSMSPTETFGIGSRCFNTLRGGSPKAQCYRANCLANGSIVADIGTVKVTCTSTGQKITIKAGEELICPNLVKMCSNLEASCAEECNGRGYCAKDKTCSCIDGWGGPTCADAITINYFQILKPSTVVDPYNSQTCNNTANESNINNSTANTTPNKSDNVSSSIANATTAKASQSNPVVLSFLTLGVLMFSTAR